MDNSEKMIRKVAEIMIPILGEREIRLLAGSLAEGYGYGGQKLVAECFHLTPKTLCKAVREINSATNSEEPASGRSGKEGGGRKSNFVKNPGLIDFIDRILQENTYGNPVSVLSYTSLSLRDIAERAATEFHVSVSRNIVSHALSELGYSKQRNRKMEQAGQPHPDRDAQFRHIDETGSRYVAEGVPFISVDCKKKENAGNFLNNGKKYRHTNDARRVLDHDFPISELGKVAPYGVYTVNDNTGFINSGTSHDTAVFAVESIRQWWYTTGKNTFPDAKKLYITADGGGSNGSRNKLWKLELAGLAEKIGLEIEVSHFPPGTSEWNKTEHRLFCCISKNWAGKPLIDIMTIVKLIASTSTKKGLKVICDVDKHIYPTGIKVDVDMADKIDIEFLGPNTAWNYVIRGFKN